MTDSAQFLLDRAPNADDEDRYVDHRSEYLKRVANFDDKHAQALALAELGYSHSGIANRLDVTDDTAKKYLDDIAAEYGDRAIDTRPQTNPVEALQ